eukprot:UN11962
MVLQKRTNHIRAIRLFLVAANQPQTTAHSLAATAIHLRRQLTTLHSAQHGIILLVTP